MQDEREKLVKQVFPQLQTLCEERDANLIEIDLRWGIPDLEVAEGRVLSICFAEIDNCYPFFIGILGNRYGTPINIISEALLEAHPWLRDHQSASITELEILYGVLERRPGPRYAFFYFKENNTEIKSNEPSTVGRLHRLKQRISSSGFPVRKFINSEDLERQVLEDFTEIIERLFPETQGLTDLEYETFAHKAFRDIHSRQFIEVHCGRQCLEWFMASYHNALVVSGPSGIGKSALVSAWLQHHEDTKTSISTQLWSGWSGAWKYGLTKSVVCHFVGATTQSNNYVEMLKRLLNEIKNQLGLSINIPDRDVAIPFAFASVLRIAARYTRLILVIDGIDRLDDRADNARLSWLPNNIPKGIKLILTTNDIKTVNEARKRHWRVLELAPLKQKERQHFVMSYLRYYGKALSPLLLKRIVKASSGSSPLYLRTLLEELRQFGIHERLAQRLDYYLVAESVEVLYQKVLTRLEEDFEHDRPNLVQDSLQLLATARLGLTETELLNLLGDNDTPLPMGLWSPFYFAIRNALLKQTGVLSFFHPALRRAVEERYLVSDPIRYALHNHLANYFARQPLTRRSLEELPWHLAVLGDWLHLSQLLANPNFLKQAWPKYANEIAAYWTQIEDRSEYRRDTGYATVLENPKAFTAILWPVLTLLTNGGYISEALKITTVLESQAHESNDLDLLQACLSQRATLHQSRGEITEALSLLQQQEIICRKSNQQTALAASLGNQGILLYSLGENLAASRCCEEEEKLCRILNDLPGLSANRGNMGILLMDKDEYKAALKLFREQEHLCRLLGDISGLQKSLDHQGLIHLQRREIKRAKSLFTEGIALCRRIGEKAGLQTLLGHQATVYQALGDYDRVMHLLDEKLSLCQDIGDPKLIGRALIKLGDFYTTPMGQPAYACTFYKKALKLACKYNLESLRQQAEQRLNAEL